MPADLTPATAPPIPRYARIDVIGGAVMVFVAALIWFGAIGLRVGELVNFGPGALPRVLALILGAAGLGMFLHGLVQREQEAEPLVLAVRPPAILGIAIFLFALFIRGGDYGIVSTPRLGLMVVGPLTVFVAGFATPEARPRELIVMAFGLTAAVLLVFTDLLGVPLPVFPTRLEDAIPPSFGTDAAVRALYIVYACVTAGLYTWLFDVPGRRRD
ncbi:tripartite tricarboxylate transporter TctB family protein [Psychromarinibacter sp. C21-152]|uniref:Tripartite tricarboxylate transporter TctB family protein n=1 Tax=Psychromarinibacter sediminicola TaxID=3033385 RepID=A0AAE3NS91_9RHOB|nr:tripartite tricarboxylate transporter TctB family protein [Psychromarinibacter sediminicola]MDF0601137.1 tripartite tricarboxylate transporter TctB family protein [Psychromarinibacter sediminicola]